MNSAVTTEHSVCGSEPGLISVDQALQMILDHTDHLAIEKRPLSQALNRFVAEDIYSKTQLPIFSQSAVDGYAICMDIDMPAESSFELIGEIRAGQGADLILEPGQAVRIFTGAKIPLQTTTVARQEIVQLRDSTIILTEALRLDADIRQAGEEICMSQCLAVQGQQLSIGTIAALSMAGIREVSVYRYPKIAVVITGDEVADTVEDLNSGKIFDANAPLIQAWFQSRNQQVEIMHVADTEQAVSALFQRLRTQYDLILTTGGVSVGDYDFLPKIYKAIQAEVLFNKIAMRPGSVTTVAVANKTYLFGLSGNPSACFTGFELFVKPAVQHMMQAKAVYPQVVKATLMEDFAKANPFTRFIRATASFTHNCATVVPSGFNKSGAVVAIAHSNAMIMLPGGTRGFKAGHTVDVILTESNVFEEELSL